MAKEQYQLGPGRPAKRPAILAVRELTVDEVRNTPRETGQQMKAIRDSHHMMARLFAMGFRSRDVAAKTGYSIARVSIISQDPAFQELVATYRETVDESFSREADEYFESANAVRVTSLRQIRDRLEEADELGEKLPLNQLVAIHSDLADRTGYPKRKESINLNLDFASRLDQAVRRSAEAKTIDGSLAAADGVLAEQRVVGKASGPHATLVITDDVGPVPDKAWGVSVPAQAMDSPLANADLPPRDGAGVAAQAKELDTPRLGPLNLEGLGLRRRA